MSRSSFLVQGAELVKEITTGESVSRAVWLQVIIETEGMEWKSVSWMWGNLEYFLWFSKHAFFYLSIFAQLFLKL